MTTADVETKVIFVEEEEEGKVTNTSESFLTILEKGHKPWYLSTSEIYKLVKGATKFIPRSGELFEQSLQAIALLTKYVNESTRINIVFDVDQTKELINKLDDLLSEQLVIVDDGFDSVRAKFNTNLKLLITALLQHSEWAQNFAKQQKDNATQVVSSQFEHALLILALLKNTAETKFPKVAKLASETIERVKSTVESGKQLYHGEVPEYIRAYTLQFLTTAQPYVHKAVNYSIPVVQKAVDVSHPYYDKASPYVTPVIEKAQAIESSLRENSQYGPYVARAVETSAYWWNELILYATPQPQATN